MNFRSSLLYLIIFIEGFIVLAYELLSLRLMGSFFGSNTVNASIIIAAVLLPLSIGYYMGGQFRPRPGFSIRKKIFVNFVIAGLLMALGSSYIFLDYAFVWAYHYLGIENYLLRMSLVSLLFIVAPVYFFGQTIPLLTYYFGKKEVSKLAGNILFVSTLGSLCGSLLTTLVLMHTIGTFNTAIVLCVLCLVCLLLLNPLKHKFLFVLSLSSVCLSIFLNNPYFQEERNIVKSNAYHIASIIEKDYKGETFKMLSLDNSPSSSYSTITGKSFAYINYMHEQFLFRLPPDIDPIDILVLGSGGFTFGLNDTKNNYTFVDVDEQLKPIAENLFLNQKLTDNKNFIAMPARGFLNITDEKYDLIFFDASNHKNFPEQLVTVQFFQTVKSKLKENGIFIANFMSSSSFDSHFSQNLMLTYSSVFWPYSRAVFNHRDPWGVNLPKVEKSVGLTIFFNRNDDFKPHIYTDSKNSKFLDYNTAINKN